MSRRPTLSRGYPTFCELLALRFNELAETNGECVSMVWSAAAGFREGCPDPASGETVYRRRSEAEVLAETARMSADLAGAFEMAGRLAAAVVEG